MRNLIGSSIGALFLALAVSSAAAAPGNVPLGVARGYAIASELEPGPNGQFSASIELRSLDSNQLVARLHARLSSGESTTIPVAAHPGVEVRALAREAGASSVRYVVEVFRLGILEARYETSVSLAPRPAGAHVHALNPAPRAS